MSWRHPAFARKAADKVRCHDRDDAARRLQPAVEHAVGQFLKAGQSQQFMALVPRLSGPLTNLPNGFVTEMVQKILFITKGHPYISQQ